MEGEQDVFSKSDNFSTSASGLQAQFSVSMPAVTHSQDLEPLSVARSRRPLSHSDLSKQQLDILDNNRLMKHHVSSRFLIGQSIESGFFSDSPASSNSSLYQLNEAEAEAGAEAGAGFPEPHEMDNFNQNGLHFLFNDFAEELGVCWKESGRYLLKKECSVENIDADYSKVSEKAYQVLLKWEKENGAATCVLDLFKCFNHIGREDVAEKVLEYLPERIQNACRIILLSSPKKIRCPSMTTKIYNIKESIQEMTVEKQVRIADEEIHLCTSKVSGKKYVLKKICEGPESCILAARLAIPEKHFVTMKRKLRNLHDFLKEIKAKEDTVNRLKEIVEQLHSKLQKDFFGFCKDILECSNCEKTKTKLELLEKESSLLHHSLDKMLGDNRKLSFTGIPTDKIYNLAERTYGICEDHKKMHSEIRNIKRRCSQEFLDIEQGLQQENDGDNSEIDDTLECTMNIIQHFARRRKVVQSLTPKRRKESKAVQRNKSDKSKSRSRFYVSVRDSFKYKKESTAKATQSGLTRKDSKKTKRSFRSKESKPITRKKGCVENPDLSYHLPTGTTTAAIVCKNGNKTDFLGPEDLDLDDPSEVYHPSFCAKNTGGQVQSPSFSSMRSTHKKIHKCKSDPESRSMNHGHGRDCHGEAVIDILTRQYYERERSQSDVPITRNKKPSRVQSARKPSLKRYKILDKSQSHCLHESLRDNPSSNRDKSSAKSQSAVLGDSSSDKPSEKRDKSSAKSQSAFLVASSSYKPSEKREKSSGKNQLAVLGASSSDKPSEKRDQSFTKSQSAFLEASSSGKPSEKRDKSSAKSQSAVLGDSSSYKLSEKLDKHSDGNQSHSSNDSSIVKPSKTRDQLDSQPESSMLVASLTSVSAENTRQLQTTSCDNVKWLKDVDTEDIIFV